MYSKLLGGVLLVVGTCFGAGMLALPVATSQMGFFYTTLLLILCWAIMTAGAYLTLEVNLWLPTNSNVISMARATLGPFGQLIAWVSYFLLLYSLLCAYISGGTDLFHSLLLLADIHLPEWLSSLIFTVIFGTVVFLGIQFVDYVNRVLMFTKLGSYLLLVILLLPVVTLINLKSGHLFAITDATATTVTITAFGYAAIIPSLRIYYGKDISSLKKAILIGSLIPLFCYILWVIVIQGAISLEGSNGLTAILKHGGLTSDLVDSLIKISHSNTVALIIHVFTSICMLTSFLGVSLCLVDFLADGLNLEKLGLQNIFLHLLTFVPPLIIDFFYPKIFITALQYSGIYCVILLILLPTLMAYSGRYHKKIHNGFMFFGGKPMLIGLVMLSVFLILWGLVDVFAHL